MKLLPECSPTSPNCIFTNSFACWTPEPVKPSRWNDCWLGRTAYKWGSPSRFINQPRSSRPRLWPHHEGAARQGSNWQPNGSSVYRDLCWADLAMPISRAPKNGSASTQHFLGGTSSDKESSFRAAALLLCRTAPRLFWRKTTRSSGTIYRAGARLAWA